MSFFSPVVFVISEDPALLQSLDTVLRRAGSQRETFASADDFLSRPRVVAPGCLVLDLARSDRDGLDLQRRLAARRGDLPIVVVTADADVPMAVQAMKAGAYEFFTKPFNDDLLLGAICGGIDRSRMLLSDQAELQALLTCYASLSLRERQVMAGVVSGRLNKQVGGELGISEITVKAHRGKVMRKMKARSLPDLVNMAARLRVGEQSKAAFQGSLRRMHFAARTWHPATATLSVTGASPATGSPS